MLSRFSPLWRHADFRAFWAAQTISQFGSQITILALPLTAAALLQATPAQMGLLVAAETAPLLLSLFAGVWVDRIRRRPLLLVADVLRTVLLLVVPAAAWLRLLQIEVLYMVAFCVGLLTVLFDVAYQAFLPVLIPRSALIEGNSKLETSRAAAQVAGPGIAGWLVQVLSAPFALLVDALTFAVSGLCIAALRTPEPPPLHVAARRSVWQEIGEGLGMVVRQPVLRALVACAATSNLASGLLDAVYVLYATRELDFSAGVIGIIFAAGNVGFLVGALFATPVVQRFGLGRSLIGTTVLDGIGVLCVPLALNNAAWSMMLLMAGRFLIGLGGTIYTINHVSLRQALVPDELQGRMNASVRFIAGGVVPLGALVGGALGTALGLRTVLWIAAAIALLAVMWLWVAPVRRLRAFPAANDHPSSLPVNA